jgi:hypothetical protein
LAPLPTRCTAAEAGAGADADALSAQSFRHDEDPHALAGGFAQVDMKQPTAGGLASDSLGEGAAFIVARAIATCCWITTREEEGKGRAIESAGVWMSHEAMATGLELGTASKGNGTQR